MTKIHTGSERRKYPRAEERVLLLYQSPEAHGTQSSTSKNIGAGGLCFETDGKLATGDILRIEMFKPIGARLEERLAMNLAGEVKWMKEIGTGRYRLGVKFIDIEDRDRNEIIKNVATRLKQ